MLIAYVSGQVQDMEMPPVGRGDPLTSQQISLLRAWIDQDANWTTTNQQPPLNFVVEPVIREFSVDGNQAKFRELEDTGQGVSGGLQNFSVTEQLSPDEKVSMNAQVIVPDQNYDFQLALDKTDFGFIHAGFDQWRKYYTADGGYAPTVFPSQFNFDNNLYVDNGRAWVDFGLDKPRWPEIVLGYEYQYQKGNESTLDWGDANGKNIYPAGQSLNEQTHTIKFDVTKTFDNWRLENNARVLLYTEKNQGMESAIILGGTTPDEFITTKDNYRQVQGMDTLVLEKQLRDWWLLNGGFYYSRLAGSDYFNQTTTIPMFGAKAVLNSEEITLNRESEIFSVANLFTPLNYLVFSIDSQNEWTRENGFSDGIPDLDLDVNVPADSSQDEFKASQMGNVRFTKIPFTVVFSDAQFSQDDYDIYQSQDTDDLQRHTAAYNLRYDSKTGFTVSPWQWTDLNVQYERQFSHTDYNQLQDLVNGIPGPTNGYPGFILDRTIVSDQAEVKWVLRPAYWLKTTLTYQNTITDYSSKTDPAYDFDLDEIVSEGGSIADGNYHLQTYGVAATLTPFRRFYFSGAFTYSWSSVTTANNGDPSIVPYQGNIFTFNASATYLLNLKSNVQLAYNFSCANYLQHNAAAGVPAGLDYQRNDLIIGFTRKLTKKMSAALHYELSLYNEPGTANANNFTANGVMASLTYQWL